MRYQKQQLDHPKYGCMTYANIGSLVGKSGNYCRMVCKQYLEALKKHKVISSIYSKPYDLSLAKRSLRKTYITPYQEQKIIDGETLAR